MYVHTLDTHLAYIQVDTPLNPGKGNLAVHEEMSNEYISFLAADILSSWAFVR